ncbi:MAG: exodeoxyribonuclease V subunit gamma [Firmicutes bacterium]|nr:exodeoxyribonuclease V subunit gamma [Bacillota bacterium]
MFLNIITGGLGSGKSNLLYELMRKNLKNNPTSKAVLIVPEQFSYTAEKTLTDRFGGLGLNNIEVITFSRLVYRFLDATKNVLPSGKRILVSKAVMRMDESNMFYNSSKKNGFTDALSEIFSEFKHYSIVPKDLEEIADDDSATTKKLLSVKHLYESYLNFFNEDFSDSDDSLDKFAELVSSSEIFFDTFFFIDDYTDFLPQHLRVIKALIAKSRGVHITLCLGNESPDSLFSLALKTKKQLQAIALDLGADLYGNHLEKAPEYIAAPDIRFLLENWDNPQKSYNGCCENLRIFAASDLYAEVEKVAVSITSLVRDKCYRYRDIGIICGDMNSYIHILNAVFSDFDIPYFADEKLAVTMHPITKTVLSLFDIIDENWSYNSVFDYLRAGYIYIKEGTEIHPISQEDVDLVENYVRRCGIRGKKAWFSEWTASGDSIFDDVIENRHRSETDLEKLNSIRLMIIRPFQKFLESRSRTVRAIAEAVFGFICDINLYDGILYEAQCLSKSGMRDESEQFKQIWNYILEVLDQMVLTMSSDVISRENFSACFKSGLSQCMLSIIPSGLDRVSVGTVERNSPSRVKVLFIIGANHGLIPKEVSSSGIFSAYDRSLINAKLGTRGKELAPDSIRRVLAENFKLYRILSTATEKLYISYSVSTPDGSSLMPASFVHGIENVFHDIPKEDNVITKPSDEELLSSAKRGFYYMLNRLSEYYHEKPDKIWQDVFNWYSKNPKYSDKLDILKAAARYKRIQPALSREKAGLLYGANKKYSITALEKYSKCPFSYYVEKGLYAQPQDEKRIEKSQIGSLIHAAVCEFCKIVETGAQSVSEIKECWSVLTRKKSEQIVSDVMDSMRTKILVRADSSTKQLEYLLSRCERTLKKSVEIIRKSITNGGYAAVCYEKDFEVDINWKNETVTLIGTIDRIDVMELAAENRVNIRIIDYKTGKKNFSVAAVCNCIDMQLVLYAVAVSKLYRSGKLEKCTPGLTPYVSAIFYNTINDEFVTIDSDDKEIAKKELSDLKKLDGRIILDDGENLDASEGIPETVRDMDSELEQNRTSSFLNVKLKKNEDSFYKSSQLESRRNFEKMAEYMQKCAVSTDKAIKSGKIDIRPYRNNQISACNYCDYREVCMFDAAFDKYRNVISQADKAMEHMIKEIESDE